MVADPRLCRSAVFGTFPNETMDPAVLSSLRVRQAEALDGDQDRNRNKHEHRAAKNDQQPEECVKNFQLPVQSVHHSCIRLRIDFKDSPS